MKDDWQRENRRPIEMQRVITRQCEATMYSRDQLHAFVKQSNEIESIFRDPSQAELDAHAVFWSGSLDVPSVESFVMKICGATLRNRYGKNVTLEGADHVPPPGYPRMGLELADLLERAQGSHPLHPHAVHLEYETLHPFMDGNGRSGRAIWAWMMLNQGWNGWGLSKGFLKAWYFQGLERSRK